MELSKHLLNGMPVGFFLAMLLISFLGVLVFFLSDVANSVKNDKRSPGKFDFWYMIRTSFARLFVGLICLAICIVYFSEISQMLLQIEEPVKMNGAVAFLLGIQIDVIVKKIVGYGKDGGKAIKKIMLILFYI